MNNITINALVEESHQTAIDKGWWDGPERNFGEQLFLMTTELAEVMEEYRKYRFDNTKFFRLEDGKPEGMAVEFADLLIRVADTCGKYGIPLQEALRVKLAYNKTRPYRHGNKHA